AEDGIRDATVTGVQTCALPIYFVVNCKVLSCPAGSTPTLHTTSRPLAWPPSLALTNSSSYGSRSRTTTSVRSTWPGLLTTRPQEIGRASCRERVEDSGGPGR